MKARIEYHDRSFLINLEQPLDISIPIKKGGVRAWYVGDPKFEPVRGENWVGRVDQGFSVNFMDIGFNPHGHGTHTECLGHITPEQETMEQGLKRYFHGCRVVSVSPDQDHCIQADSFSSYLQNPTEAIVIRTLPNDPDKTHRDHSGSEPPFLSEESVKLLVENGVEHLLIDTPSIDPENDGGKVLAHKAFFGWPDDLRRHATITELIFVPDEIHDGFYFLDLQVSAFANDAAPSRPILYQPLDL